jgi:hypothetical protein
LGGYLLEGHVAFAVFVGQIGGYYDDLVFASKVCKVADELAVDFLCFLCGYIGV